MRLRKLGLVVLAAIGMAGCHMGQVQVPLTDVPSSRLVWRDKLDANVFTKKTNSLRLSFDTSTLGLIKAGPAVTFKRSIEQQWNENVNTVNTMYRALCHDWNAGLLSVERFNERRERIDNLYAVLAQEKTQFQDAFYEYWKKQSDAMFAELDAALDREAEREAESLAADLQRRMASVNERVADIRGEAQ